MAISYIVLVDDEVVGPFPTIKAASATFDVLRFIGYRDLQIMPEYMAPKRPRDPNQLGKLIVDIATGERSDAPPPTEKDPAAVQRGRLGGVKGGKARAEKMTPGERKASASAAAKARWRS